MKTKPWRKAELEFLQKEKMRDHVSRKGMSRRFQHMGFNRRPLDELVAKAEEMGIAFVQREETLRDQQISASDKPIAESEKAQRLMAAKFGGRRFDTVAY